MTADATEYTQHREAILSYLARRLRNRQEAEDLCQDTFVRVLRVKERIRDPGKTLPYLYRTAHNLLINHYRRRHVVLRADDMADPIDLEQVADRNADTEAPARFGELSAKLEIVLGGLSQEHRKAFELGVIQRLVYREIARLTGWSCSKVKVNIHRARKQVTAQLAEYRSEIVRTPRKTSTGE